jgi:hypothetical protein
MNVHKFPSVRATDFYSLGRHQEALTQANEFVDAQERWYANSPDQSKDASQLVGAYRTRARIYYALGNVDSAIRDSDKAIMLCGVAKGCDWDEYHIHLDRAVMELDRGNVDRAVAECNIVMKLPKSADWQRVCPQILKSVTRGGRVSPGGP